MKNCSSCRYWAGTEKPPDAGDKKTQRRLCRRAVPNAVFDGSVLYPKSSFKCKNYESRQAYRKKKEYEEKLEARLMEKSF